MNHEQDPANAATPHAWAPARRYRETTTYHRGRRLTPHPRAPNVATFHALCGDEFTVTQRDLRPDEPTHTEEPDEQDADGTPRTKGVEICASCRELVGTTDDDAHGDVGATDDDAHGDVDATDDETTDDDARGDVGATDDETTDDDAHGDVDATDVDATDDETTDDDAHGDTTGEPSARRSPPPRSRQPKRPKKKGHAR